MKVLTFVIPAYNSERFLDACIGSMLAPEVLDRLEILIVNDGSTDGTAYKAQEYCIRYPETIRLLSQENRGHGGALNSGFAAAQGKYLKAVDADDSVDTESLPALIHALETCESDVVLTHFRTRDVRSGNTEEWKCTPASFGKTYTLADIMVNWRGFKRCMVYHGIAYRTDFYQKYAISLPEHVFYEDHEYATFPCCQAQSITPLDLFLYVYRIGDAEQSVSDVNQARRIGHIEAVLADMVMRYRTQPPSPGRNYTARKIEALLLDYLTTALLASPDRKAGRIRSASLMARLRSTSPELCAAVHQKYLIFRILGRLHVKKSTWKRLTRSRLYGALRGRKS